MSSPTSGPTWSRRLTWGTNWGLPGGFDNYGNTALNQRRYSQHATSHNGAFNGLRADGMLSAYSVFTVLGPHAGSYLDGAVGRTVQQMENNAAARLKSTAGTVVASGPAGVGNAAATPITYTPAGYNPTFATWDVIAAGNAADAILTPASGRPLNHPIFLLHGYGLGQLPKTISVGAGLSRPDVDYFATLDPATRTLWVTVNRLATSPVRLRVTPP